MKFIIATLLLTFSFRAHAVIDATQTETVLKHLDQACGDLWCEGFYEIESRECGVRAVPASVKSK